MSHLYKLNALHRDLKLPNIFIHFPTMEGHENDINNDWLRDANLHRTPFVIKIGDLGFAKILDNINELSETYCGTPINMAPEMLNKNSYNYKADVWSVGTLLFELIAGFSPFKQAKNKDQLKDLLHKSWGISIPTDLIISKDCLRFIDMCLTYNPLKRPSWQQLKEHNFIRYPFDMAADFNGGGYKLVKVESVED